MNVEFQCQNCERTLRVDRQYLGRQARCPNCKAINEVADCDNSADLLPTYGSTQVPDRQVEIQSADRGAGPLPLKIPSQCAAGPNASAAEPDGQGFTENPYTSPSGRSTAWHGNNPHRGGLILALGILAATCNFFLIPGIMAWVMGASDLKKMKAGYMDSEGQGLTTAGMALGIIFTLLILVPLVLYILFILFILVVAMAAG